MNEDEAKTKWCPMFGNDEARCIASECMWWVWDEYEDVGDKMVPSLPIGGHCGAIKCP